MNEKKLSHRMHQIAKEYGGTGLLWKDDLEGWASEVVALEAELEACTKAKSLLYPPGTRYLNNPDNMNDPRMLDERGEVVEP